MSKILFKPEVDENVALRNICTQDLSGDLDNVLDHRLIAVSQLALEKKIQVYGDFSILNTDCQVVIVTSLVLLTSLPE